MLEFGEVVRVYQEMEGLDGGEGILRRWGWRNFSCKEVEGSGGIVVEGSCKEVSRGGGVVGLFVCIWVLSTGQSLFITDCFVRLSPGLMEESAVSYHVDFEG